MMQSVMRFARTLRLSNPDRLGLRSAAATFIEHGGTRVQHIPPPLCIFCGWMGASDRAMAKYLSLWHERGVDTYSYSVNPLHVLFPSLGQRKIESVMNSVRRELSGEVSMSVGGFLFGQYLRSLKRDGTSRKKDVLLKNVVGQVFDSPPDINGIAAGITESMGIGGFREKLINNFINSYLHLTKSTAGVHYTKASKIFYDNPLSVPALWYFSSADAVSRIEDCRSVCSSWKNLGVNVTEVVLEDSPHIQHLRTDPDLYNKKLDEFLKTVNLPEKVKFSKDKKYTN